MSSIETVDVGNAVKMMILGTGYFFVSLSVSRIGDLGIGNLQIWITKLFGYLKLCIANKKFAK